MHTNQDLDRTRNKAEHCGTMHTFMERIHHTIWNHSWDPESWWMGLSYLWICPPLLPPPLKIFLAKIKNKQSSTIWAHFNIFPLLSFVVSFFFFFFFFFFLTFLLLRWNPWQGNGRWKKLNFKRSWKGIYLTTLVRAIWSPGQRSITASCKQWKA